MEVIKNLSLTPHAQGLGTEWASGPVVRCDAFRDLILCQEEDTVVGLIVIGWSKNGVGRWEKYAEETNGYGWRCFEKCLIKSV